MRKMKNALIFCTVFILLIGFTIYKSFFQYPQSTPEELKTAFSQAVKKADSLNMLQGKNPEWKMETWAGTINYAQNPDWEHHRLDEYSVGLSFKISQDGKKIILTRMDHANITESLGAGVSLNTFGAGYQKIRVYQNAEDFSKKFDQLIEDRKANLESCDDLTLEDYYPGVSMRNWTLSFKDNKDDYDYE